MNMLADTGKAWEKSFVHNIWKGYNERRKMEKIKKLKDLDLVDRFLFAEVMEDEGSLADVL